MTGEAGKNGKMNGATQSSILAELEKAIQGLEVVDAKVIFEIQRLRHVEATTLQREILEELKGIRAEQFRALHG